MLEPGHQPPLHPAGGHGRAEGLVAGYVHWRDCPPVRERHHVRALRRGQLTNKVQAVEYWRGHYWLTDDTRDEVIRVKADGRSISTTARSSLPTTTARRSLATTKASASARTVLAVLADPTSANSYMILLDPGEFRFRRRRARYGTDDGYFEATGLTGSTTFTLSASGAGPLRSSRTTPLSGLLVGRQQRPGYLGTKKLRGVLRSGPGTT